MKNFLIIACLLFSTSLFAQNPKVKPSIDPSLHKFIYDLHVAVENKDKAFILKSLSDKIMVSFGDNPGIDNFKRQWNLESGETRLWSVLRRILRMGGVFDEDGYTAPFVFVDWPDDYDPFEYEMVVGENVNLRKGPGTDYEVIGQLSFDIVFTDYDKSTEDWSYVITYDRKTEGYIYSPFVYGPVDYRMGISKVNNAWKITFLVAGD